MTFFNEHKQANEPASLSETLLAELVQELDHEDLVGMMLGGSYARGDATRYSDLDFACFWREGLRPPPKRFFYRQGKLVSVKQTSVSELRAMLNRPESALLFASGKRRLLLDKDGSVTRFLEELANFRWETLQNAAYASCSLWQMLMAEEVHKLLREFLLENEPGLSYAITKLLPELTLIVALFKGVMITSDSTYYQQVEETMGSASAWSSYHRIAAGLQESEAGIKPLRARGLAALLLYCETLALVRSIMQSEHLAVAEQVVKIARESVDRLSFTPQERRWLINAWPKV